MFRLLRLIFVLGGLCGFAWFAMTVKLGDRTFFEHVQAIWKSPASQELVRGAKDKVGTLIDHGQDKGEKDDKGAHGSKNTTAAAHAENGGEAPLEEVPNKDRKELRGIIGHHLEKP